MSSVIDYIECPTCGGVVTRSLSTRSMEDSRFCNRCGYGYFHGPKLDATGKFIFDEDGMVKVIENEFEPHGAIRVMLNNGMGISDRVAEDFKLDEWLETLERDLIDEEDSYVTRYNKETDAVLVIWGEGIPMMFDEFEGSL